MFCSSLDNESHNYSPLRTVNSRDDSMTVFSMIIKNPHILLKLQFFSLHSQHSQDVEFLILPVCTTKITLNIKEPIQDKH